MAAISAGGSGLRHTARPRDQRPTNGRASRRTVRPSSCLVEVQPQGGRRRPTRAAARAATPRPSPRTPAAPSTSRAGRAGRRQALGGAEEEVDADRADRREQADDDARDRPGRREPRPPDAEHEQRAERGGGHGEGRGRRAPRRRCSRRAAPAPTITTAPASGASRSRRRPAPGSRSCATALDSASSSPSDVARNAANAPAESIAVTATPDRPAVDPLREGHHDGVGVAGEVAAPAPAPRPACRRPRGTGRTR